VSAYESVQKLLSDEDKDIKIGLTKKDVAKAYAMSKILVTQEKS
jgi:hypothetical protein